MSSGISRFSKSKTGVFWDVDHCPIPNELSPASVSDNIKSALSNMGYTGEVAINAYTDKEHIRKDFESAGINLIRLGDNRSNRFNRGEILSDICMWACDHRRQPTNVMLISKDVSEDAFYAKSLLAIKSQAHNILLAQPLNASGLLRTIPSCIWLWTCLSIGGLPQVVTPSPSIGDDQSGSSHIVTPSPTIGAPLETMSSRISRFSTAETVVFWNLDKCPIPNDLTPASISDNIKLALKNIGYTGQLSIFAYSQSKQIKQNFEMVGIILIELDSVVNASVMIDNHVARWWGMVERYEPKNLLVISKEDVDTYHGFIHVKNNDNNLFLAHPQYTSEEIPSTATSIWLWDSLSRGGIPFHNRTLSPTTDVFWDLDTCPVSEDLSPGLISLNIKSALKNMGYTGVSIVAYTERIDNDFEGDGIKLIRLGTNLSKYERLFLDICLWGMHNQQSIIMVISSKNVFDSDFVLALAKIKSKGNDILLALPHHPSKLLLDTARSVWRWNSLSVGGLPLDTPTPIIRPPFQMKPCGKKRKSSANISKE